MTLSAVLQGHEAEVTQVSDAQEYTLVFRSSFHDTQTRIPLYLGPNT